MPSQLSQSLLREVSTLPPADNQNQAVSLEGLELV